MNSRSAIYVTSERGQTIVLIALMMVFFIGVTGLVVDVGGAYARQRYERSVSDSASLAGVQQLQTPSRRQLPTAANYESARELAMRSLVNQLADPTDPLPACPSGPPYVADFENCNIPGTSYYVSVSAPAVTCVTLGGCDARRSVQVTVRQPDFGLVFAKIFDQAQWNVVATSVAELGFSANYTLVTLRPPRPSRANDPRCAPNCDSNEGNITLSGTNTRAFIDGDVGTNTNVTLTAGAQIVMDPAYNLYHYDLYVNWTPPPDPKQLSSPIPDPNYPIPSPVGGDEFSNLAQARITDPVDCNAERDKVPADYSIASYDAAADEIVCLKPGVYLFKFRPSIDTPQARVVLLTPGLYFFNLGFDAGSNVSLIGGYEPNSTGVALVLPSGADCAPPCKFDVESSPLVALNAGSAYPDVTRGDSATAALDYSGNPVDNGGDPPILMTIIVQKDSRCVVGPTEPTDCPNLNQLKLPGGGSLYLTGIQYAASDMSTVVGGSAGSGYIGQFISWTVTYTGGSQLTFTHAGDEGPGVMRIATPCSPKAACAADYADDPIP